MTRPELHTTETINKSAGKSASANAVATAFNEPNGRGGSQSISKLILERPLQAIPFVLLTTRSGLRNPKKLGIRFPP
jgi:hypothetical protein